MANPIDDRMRTGTIGELLVQIRLLQHNIQAAPPIKDSGNDLVALKGRQIRLIQVKSTKNDIFPKLPGARKIYDLLAIVVLKGHDRTLFLDESKIYLIKKAHVSKIPRSLDQLDAFEIERVVDGCFSTKWHLDRTSQADRSI
jgi:hypothetical protein